MIVVSDTSPLNYLVLIGQVGLLPKLFQRVVVPLAVVAELQHPGAPDIVRQWAAEPPTWLEVQQPFTTEPMLEPGLGVGETQVINLARQLEADIVLMDERHGRTKARQVGLFVTGILGVLEIAAQDGLVDLSAVTNDLRRTTFRVSPHLLDAILRRAAARAK